MTSTPLAVLDLLPVSDGATNAEAVQNAVDLAVQTERFGYQRYWFAEHHLNPGVIGASPAIAIALVAGATSTIRLGSAGVQFGHRTPLMALSYLPAVSLVRFPQLVSSPLSVKFPCPRRFILKAS